VIVVAAVSTMATITAAPSPSISTPGSAQATNSTTAPLSTSAPSPSVSTVSGSAKRMIAGQKRPLTRPMTATARTDSPNRPTVTDGITAAAIVNAAASTRSSAIMPAIRPGAMAAILSPVEDRRFTRSG
jgi:hypothetical protein